MQKYSEGDVSAILRQSKPPVNSNVVDKDYDSKRTGRKEITRLAREALEKDIAQTGKPLLPSVSEESFNDSKGLKRRNREKEVSGGDYSNIYSSTVADLAFKRRKAPTEKILDSDNANSLLGNANKADITMKKKLKVGISESCKKGFTGLSELKNLKKKDTNNFQLAKCFKRKVEISNESDKSEFTIFVGNLPLSYDHKRVVKIFSKFGEVENARIRCVPVANPNVKKRISVITKNFHPSRNSAVAYVVFKSKDSVLKATAQNGMILNGHHLRIDSAVPQKKDAKKCVFVGSLPFDIKDDELWDLFKDCGEIEGVRVIRDKDVSMGKGFGYINFKSSASVELALKLNGKEIRNQKINVERCKQKEKKRNDLTASFLNGRQRKRQNEKSQSLLHGRKTKITSSENEFQGSVAQQKSKKKKLRRTKDATRKKLITSMLLSSPATSDKMRRGLKH